MTSSTGRGRVRLSVGLILALPVLSGCADAPAPSIAPSSESKPPASISPTPVPQPAPEPPDIPRASADLGQASALGAVRPARILIPQLSIDMPVDAMGLDPDGAMALPENAATAGWYRYGPGLHDASGATVIAAHVDSRHDGIGPFSRLKDAAPGSTIAVVGSDGTSVDYSVTEVRSVGKIDAPMAEVFDRSGEPRIVLVTCGGAFDSSTGHYVDNIILTAVPAIAPGG